MAKLLAGMEGEAAKLESGWASLRARYGVFPVSVLLG